MRRKSLETFGETSVRKHKANDNNDVTQKRSKKFDTSAYLVEKSKQDYEIRSRELELKEKELEMQKKKINRHNINFFNNKTWLYLK